MCERLTSLFWPHHSLYPWSGQPFRPDYISKFAERLKDIRKVRTVHRQITRLLSPSEITDFKLDSSFKCFMDMNVLNLSPYNEATWRDAVKHFENSIKPAEEHVGSKILQHFQTVNVNTMQLLQEFRKYQELIERPLVRSLLTPQRECLLGLLQDHVAKLNADGFDDKCNWSINYDMSPLVKKIYWLHQQESQIGQVEKTISFVLKDLNGFNELEESVRGVRKQLKDAISELLDSWTREVGSAIAGKRLGLRTSEPVVQFEQGKLMKVNYNPQLVALVKDVRQISVLGYSVPASIVETAAMARSFINQARSLQQVATFHNTIGDRMIVSQRPMMLAAAVELARLVREQHSVTWKNTNAVDSYIQKLQSAVDRLYKENTQLVTHHNKINNIVMSLMDTDLLRQQQRWKEGLREIREIMSRVEEDFTNTKSWRSHWDHQIYNLEYRYRVGLERLNEHLPEIRTDLVYRQQQLTFSPPIEDVRMKYYRQLKHFLAIPLSLRGVSDVNIFPSIIDNNAHRFVRVFEKAKDLFTRVLAVCDEWQDWVALGSVDWDVLIEHNLLTADDWALNFRASKALGQQIAKLSSSERKVDCIVISVAPVRAEVEMHNRRYWDILSSSLHSSVIQDVNKLENFILESKSSLEKAPQSLQEVGEINSKFESISESAKNMFTLIESADKKNKILASWTKEHVDDVSRMSMLWENFQGLLSNQQYIISKQVDMMKSNLVADAERLQSEIERFALRWEQMKPREDNFQEEIQGQRVMQFLKEKREKWDELTQSVKTMTEDFTRFGIKDDLPDFPQIDQVEQDLKHHEGTWALYICQRRNVFRQTLVGNVQFVRFAIHAT
ncbi:hypothetical protein LSTR_LSTR016848 [Laodelphax striatellus]|uniref:Dynein heavy chain tail domain-containing protein n=1 Tax=Laodelphax striatellus TaxID=195883 RepID=A0A482XC53_LAOST|nr:hypothetical protein LSTR_LSTR016848 [Laodelphax striatellus]